MKNKTTTTTLHDEIECNNPGKSGNDAVGQRRHCFKLGLDVELRLTEGPASPAVLAVSEAVGADVVVLSTHHLHSDDHASVTTTVLERTHRLVLALHDARVETNALHFDVGSGDPQVMLVPTDLTPESRNPARWCSLHGT